MGFGARENRRPLKPEATDGLSADLIGRFGGRETIDRSTSGIILSVGRIICGGIQCWETVGRFNSSDRRLEVLVTRLDSDLPTHQGPKALPLAKA
jgi:hypothetical protein